MLPKVGAKRYTIKSITGNECVRNEIRKKPVLGRTVLKGGILS